MSEIRFTGRATSFHRKSHFMKVAVGKHPDKERELRVFLSLINNGDYKGRTTIMLDTHELAQLFLYCSGSLPELKIVHDASNASGSQFSGINSLYGREDGDKCWINLQRGEDRRSIGLSQPECFELSVFLRSAIEDLHNAAELLRAAARATQYENRQS